MSKQNKELQPKGISNRDLIHPTSQNVISRELLQQITIKILREEYVSYAELITFAHFELGVNFLTSEFFAKVHSFKEEIDLPEPKLKESTDEEKLKTLKTFYRLIEELDLKHNVLA